MDTKCTTSPNRSSQQHSEPSPALAGNTPTSSFIRTDTTSFSSTIPKLRTSACAVHYDPAHYTLSCLLLPRNALSNIATVHDRNLKDRNIGNHTERPLTPIATSTVIVIFPIIVPLLPHLNVTVRFYCVHAMPHHRQIAMNRKTTGRDPP